MYEHESWSTAQATQGLFLISNFLSVYDNPIEFYENFGECVSYLRGNVSENDQQQGLDNGSAPFCNRPRFLRLPHTQGCHQHL